MSGKPQYISGMFLGPNKHMLVKRVRGYKPTRAIFNCSFCGTQFESPVQVVTLGRRLSCGCKTSEGKSLGGKTSGANSKKHGLVGSIYWCNLRNMLNRCNDPTNIHYKYYGAKGITVGKEWYNVLFFKRDVDYLLEKHGLDIGDWGKGKDQYTLDRIDGTKGYFLGNVRFATKTEQRLNRV